MAVRNQCSAPATSSMTLFCLSLRVFLLETRIIIMWRHSLSPYVIEIL